jgi:hypothetical protein
VISKVVYSAMVCYRVFHQGSIPDACIRVAPYLSGGKKKYFLNFLKKETCPDCCRVMHVQLILEF